MKKKDIVYITTILCITFSLLAACVLFLRTNYEGLIQYISGVLNRPDIAVLLRTKLLPQSKFFILQKICLGFLVIIPAAAFILIKKRRIIFWAITKLTAGISFAFRSVYNVYRNNSKLNNAIVFGLLLITIIKALFYIFSWDLQYDEMWCYNYFTSQPFYFSFFMYSNYPLYELSTQVFKWLPFDMKINLRLPGLIMGIITFLMLYACLKKILKNHLTAFAGVALFAFMPVTTFYMLYARGVMFELFFALTAFFSLFFYFYKHNRVEYLVIYILSNLLGIYAMPTHVYFWMLLVIYGAFVCYSRNKNFLVKFIIYNLVIAILAFVLYAPILVSSGVSFVADSFQNRSDFYNALKHVGSVIKSTSYFFTGWIYGFTIISAILIAALFIKRRTIIAGIALFALMLILLPLLLFVVQGVSLPERSLAFVGLSLPFAGCILVECIATERKYLVYLSIAICSIGLAVISHTHSFLNWSRLQDKEAIDMAHVFMEHNIHTCYDNTDISGFFYFYPALEYYYRINNEVINFNVASKNSTRYKPFSLSDNYDCVAYDINDSSMKTTSQYKPLYNGTSLPFKIVVKKDK